MARGFLIALAALVAGACTQGSALGLVPYVVQQGHIDLARGPDGNTVILDAPDGLIVVDTGRHAEHSKAIVDHAHSVGKPVAAILNTHWHLDHTTGNHDVRMAFPAARVIATGAGEGALSGFLASGIAASRATIADDAAAPADRAAAQRRLAAVDDRASFLPGVPVERDGIQHIAGRALELHVASAAVTESDLWFVDPQENIAVVGDLVVAQAPFFDTGCEEGWVRALDEIAAARWNTLIPGHGETMDRAAFSRWRAAFDGFLNCGRSEATPSECADRWLADARGFYAESERTNVRNLIEYYVAQVLRAPVATRMAYCRSGG